MTREKGLLVVRHTGHSMALATLVAAQAQAEVWAEEDGEAVEVRSLWTGETVLWVGPLLVGDGSGRSLKER